MMAKPKTDKNNEMTDEDLFELEYRERKDTWTLRQQEWRNEHAKQIDKAVSLFAAKTTARKGLIRYDIERALIEIDLEHGELLQSFFDETKPAKKAARRLAKALEEVRLAANDKDLPYGLEAQDLFDNAVGKGRLADYVGKLLDECLRIDKPSGKHPRKEAELKRLVIAKAAALLEKYSANVSLATLAETLHGPDAKGKKVNLTSQCKAFMRDNGIK